MSETKINGFGIGEAGKNMASTPLDDIEAALLQPVEQERMVRCSCGHIVMESLVMHASLGTSCDACYDKMSD